MLRSSFLLGTAALLVGASFLTACSASNTSGFGKSSNVGGSSGSGTTGVGTFEGSTGTVVPPADCHSGPNDDADGDGWTPAQGDCNDCDPNSNPGAIDTLDMNGMPADNNCDGTPGDAPPPCDSGLALDDTDPMSAAKAIGLCQLASADNTRGMPGWAWGLMSAAYVRADGTGFGNPGPQVGIMSSFGTAPVVPQEGSSMLLMSSGHARQPGQPDFCMTDSCVANPGVKPPDGFPVKVPGCPGGPGTPINDDVALQVELRAPTNATGFQFKFRFYSYEFPEYVCSQYNDQFISLMGPAPTGSQNGNISFDAMGNPVSVNIGFFDVCNPNSGQPYTGPNKPNPYCPSGDADLLGTGFDAIPSGNWGGATSWLVTNAPVGGGEEFSIRFVIWDAGDHKLDSTVLIDGFAWLAGSAVSIGTGKVSNPK